MRKPRIQAQSLWRVTIAGREADLFFTKVDGISATRSSEKVSDGYSREKQSISGNVEFGDVTLEKPSDPDIDDMLMALIIDECRDVEESKFDILITPVSACGNEPVAKSTRLVGCQITSVTKGGIDLDGTGVSMTQMVVSPTSIK